MTGDTDPVGHAVDELGQLVKNFHGVGFQSGTALIEHRTVELVDDLDAQALRRDIEQQLVLERRQRLTLLDRGVQLIHEAFQSRLLFAFRRLLEFLAVQLCTSGSRSTGGLGRSVAVLAGTVRDVHRATEFDHAVAGAALAKLARRRHGRGTRGHASVMAVLLAPGPTDDNQWWCLAHAAALLRSPLRCSSRSWKLGRRCADMDLRANSTDTIGL
jgi:hypothetical protein